MMFLPICFLASVFGRLNDSNDSSSEPRALFNPFNLLGSLFAVSAKRGCELFCSEDRKHCRLCQDGEHCRIKQDAWKFYKSNPLAWKECGKKKNSVGEYCIQGPDYDSCEDGLECQIEYSKISLPPFWNWAPICQPKPAGIRD